MSFDLGDLSAKIDEAKAKIHSLGDTIHIKTDIDNGTLKQIAQDTEAMHRIMGKNEALRIKADLDDGEAKARLEALTRPRTATVRVKVNKSDLDQAESFFSKIGNLLGSLGGGHSFNLPFTNMTANPIGLAAIIGGIAALLPELAGVVSGFAAAGAGAAAFAALAAPAVKSVMSAYSGLNAAQKAYNQAKAKEALDPSKANETALTKAADNLKLAQQTIDKLPASERQAISGLQGLSTEFHSMSKAFEPQVFKVFNAGLRLASTLLPTIAPFASTFATSLTKILTNLNTSAHGKGFQDFLKQFQGISGPAIMAIAAGIGQVAGSVGRLLTVMSGKDVAHTLAIAFSAISGTIGGLTTTIKFLMNAWDGMGLAINNVKGSLHSIASAFDTARHFLAGAGHDIAQDFDQARHAVATVAHSIASAFDHVRHDIAAKFDGVKAAIMAKFAGAGAWLSDKAHAIANAFDHVRHDIAAKFDGVKGFITGKFAGASGWLVSAGEAIMSGLLAGLASAWGKVAGFLSGLKAKIQSLKGPLDYDRVMLYPHGQAIMQGLMAGMGSQVPALEAQLRGITSTIAGLAGNHAAPGGAADQPIHVSIQIDGREIANAVAQRSVQTQRRTGTNGMTKRTR